jgi:hypothetical protein
MIPITKTTSETVTQSFAGFRTYQLWVTAGDVTATAQVTATGVDIQLTGGTPGSHRVTFKVSGADPELFDTFDITVAG